MAPPLFHRPTIKQQIRLIGNFIGRPVVKSQSHEWGFQINICTISLPVITVVTSCHGTKAGPGLPRNCFNFLVHIPYPIYDMIYIRFIKYEIHISYMIVSIFQRGGG